MIINEYKLQCALNTIGKYLIDREEKRQIAEAALIYEKNPSYTSIIDNLTDFVLKKLETEREVKLDKTDLRTKLPLCLTLFLALAYATCPFDEDQEPAGCHVSVLIIVLFSVSFLFFV